MKYENPTIPEGINVSEEHPLKDFAILAGGIGLATILLVVALSFAAGWLVKFVPFELEQKLAQDNVVSALAPSDKNKAQPSEQHQQIEHYLQNLANELSVAQQLPEGMSIQVHYVDDETVNAFATLGGHVVMFSGLLKKLPHENALAMVMAHEIAHIKHRDPIIAAGRGLTVGLALAALTGFGDSSASHYLVNQVNLLTQLSFNRSQETEADREAMRTLQNHYGHVIGADTLFEVLQASHDGLEPPEILSSHPITEDRINAIKQHQFAGSDTRKLLKDLPDFIPRQSTKADPQKLIYKN